MLQVEYWGNSVRAYLVAASVVVAILLAVRIAKHILVTRGGLLVRRTASGLDDTLLQVVDATRLWLTLFIALYAASLFLVLPPGLAGKARTAAVIALLVQIGSWSSAAIAATVERVRDKKLAQGETAGLGLLAMIGFFARVVAWVIMILLILDNLGVDVTALVAGLGIGGVAIALAVQNVLQDVFASVSITLDRPFEIGDTIHIDDHIGKVQHVGIKTTRLRSLNGEELVFANADLLKSRIRNYRRMLRRRVLFTVGVTVSTPVDVLEKLPGIFREIIESQEGARFDRAHLKGFGQHSLDFEIVYFFGSPEYVLMMDTQQRVVLAILRRLSELGVSLAYPTRTLHIASGGPGDRDPGRDGAAEGDD
ncbi:MAG TPA: mechanosensitive ion channel family protein [Kofleriaceae bacterium]|nr:mechanosensitive ion channel family protein [Kofleriaceae bacterium]